MSAEDFDRSVGTEQGSDRVPKKKESKKKREMRELHESAAQDKDKLECRMYRKEWPEIGDILFVEVRSKADHGAYCSLLEYNGLEGFILYSELQRKRIRSLKGVISEGNQEVVTVLRVNQTKGYIDLSRKRVTSEEKQKKRVTWNKSKAVHSVMRELAIVLRMKYSVEELYELFGWDLYDLFPPPRHAYDAFKMAMSDRERFLYIVNNHIIQTDKKGGSSSTAADADSTATTTGGDSSTAGVSDEKATEEMPSTDDASEQKIPKDVADALFEIIERKMKPKLVSVRAKVQVTCFSKHGIVGIKDALEEGLKKSRELRGELNDMEGESDLSIQLITPPDYTLSMDTFEPFDAIEVLNKCIVTIQENISKFGGTLNIENAPHVASDTHTGIQDYVPASDD